jgi:hypothetical protein
MADQMSGFRPQKAYITNEDPLYGFAADGSTDDTAKFTAMRAEVAFATMDVDLKGKTYFVTAVPAGKFHNGYFKLTNLDNSAPIELPAPRTLDRRILCLDGGRITPLWPQDTMCSYNGVGYLGYKATFGHSPSFRGWFNAVSTNQFASIARDQKQDFRFPEPHSVNVFACCTVPPTDIDSGAFQIAVAQVDATASSQMCYRALAEFDQDPTGGSLLQQESTWKYVVVNSTTFGAALRSVMNSAYSITTSGIPTLVHSMTCVGSSNGVGGNVVFGFHGLTGASAGPHLGYINSSPKDGAAAFSSVGRIGLLTQGVEPTVSWYMSGASSRLCGFVRSQGSGYPIRFYSATGLTQAAIEAAVVQDCPWGNDFASTSPIPCRMRPRRKGATSGWIPTGETLNGTSTDELHFVFTGTRYRDGGPGPVGLYWGRVTKGSGEFADMWTRCTLVKIKDLYFSNSNLTDTSNQVGIPSMCFTDANTLHLAYNTMRPALGGDDDSGYLEVMTIKLDDAYADAPQNWDSGASTPTTVHMIPEHIVQGPRNSSDRFKTPNFVQRRNITSNSWISSTSAADNNWRSICWADSLGLFVAVSSNGTGNRVMTSPDGENWTSRTSAADESWRAVCWSPELRILVAVANTGTGNRVMTSPDGVTWTSRTSAGNYDWNSVCWAPELWQFVAVASNGTGAMTSPDGINWTLRNSAAANQWVSVCWSPELWRYVAVANSGTGNRVMTSENGWVWIAQTTPADNDWESICWSPELRLFVAVAVSGTGNRVMTSPDGEVWTLRTSAADNPWLSVCWAPRIGLFAAVSNFGSGNTHVMTSPDGENWTLGTSAADREWWSVCWSDDLGLFAAAAITGTGDRVMTSKSAFSVSYR